MRRVMARPRCSRAGTVASTKVMVRSLRSAGIVLTFHIDVHATHLIAAGQKVQSRGTFGCAPDPLHRLCASRADVSGPSWERVGLDPRDRGSLSYLREPPHQGGAWPEPLRVREDATRPRRWAAPRDATQTDSGRRGGAHDRGRHGTRRLLRRSSRLRDCGTMPPAIAVE